MKKVIFAMLVLFTAACGTPNVTENVTSSDGDSVAMSAVDTTSLDTCVVDTCVVDTCK